MPLQLFSCSGLKTEGKKTKLEWWLTECVGYHYRQSNGKWTELILRFSRHTDSSVGNLGLSALARGTSMCDRQKMESNIQPVDYKQITLPSNPQLHRSDITSWFIIIVIPSPCIKAGVRILFSYIVSILVFRNAALLVWLMIVISRVVV